MKFYGKRIVCEKWTLEIWYNFKQIMQQDFSPFDTVNSFNNSSFKKMSYCDAATYPK